MGVERKEKYLDKPPVSCEPDFRYPILHWPKRIWNTEIVSHDPDYGPEPVFITQLDLPEMLPPTRVYLFGFKILMSKITLAEPDPEPEEGDWIRVYCIKEYRRDRKTWRELFLQQYEDDCDGTFYRQYDSQICESWEYEDLKNKSQYNLSGKQIYWGQHPTKMWPKGPDGLLYLVAQVKEKRRKFATDAFSGGMRFMLFSGEIDGELDYAIYFVN